MENSKYFFTKYENLFSKYKKWDDVKSYEKHEEFYLIQNISNPIVNYLIEFEPTEKQSEKIRDLLIFMKFNFETFYQILKLSTKNIIYFLSEKRKNEDLKNSIHFIFFNFFEKFEEINSEYKLNTFEILLKILLEIISNEEKKFIENADIEKDLINYISSNLFYNEEILFVICEIMIKNENLFKNCAFIFTSILFNMNKYQMSIDWNHLFEKFFELPDNNIKMNMDYLSQILNSIENICGNLLNIEGLSQTSKEFLKFFYNN